MTTEEYIQRLRKKFGCKKVEWDEYLRRTGDDKFQEELNTLPSGNVPARKNVQARIKEIRETSPTELADRDIQRIVDLVKAHLTDSESATLRGLYFAHAWTSRLNALATRSPSGDRVVLMNRGCIVSFVYASIAFSDFYMNTPYTKAGTFIREDVRLFVASLEALGGPEISNDVDVTEIQRRVIMADRCKAGFADMLSLAMACFVVAHEMAHHILGHQGDLAPSHLAMDGNPLLLYRYSRLKEYEADKYAWGIFHRVQTEMTRDVHMGEAFSMSKYCALAPLLFMLLVESAQFLNADRHVTQAAESDTHPCGYERRRALEPLVRPCVDQEVLRFAVGVNFFLYKSVPAFFKGYIPDGTIFVFAPLFDMGEENHEMVMAT